MRGWPSSRASAGASRQPPRGASGRAQLALFLLILRDLEGQLGKKRFNIEKVDEQLTWLTSELDTLAKRAILEQDASGRYTIGSVGFRLWVIECKIAPAYGTTTDIPQWLHDKEFKLGGMVTNEEIELLKKVARSIPSDLVDMAKKMILPS